MINRNQKILIKEKEIKENASLVVAIEVVDLNFKLNELKENVKNQLEDVNKKNLTFENKFESFTDTLSTITNEVKQNKDLISEEVKKVLNETLSYLEEEQKKLSEKISSVESSNRENFNKRFLTIENAIKDIKYFDFVTKKDFKTEHGVLKKDIELNKKILKEIEDEFKTEIEKTKEDFLKTIPKKIEASDIVSMLGSLKGNKRIDASFINNLPDPRYTGGGRALGILDNEKIKVNSISYLNFGTRLGVSVNNKGIPTINLTSDVGDVFGPATTTDDAIARFDGTTGKLIQNSSASIDNNGNITANNLSGTNTGDQDLSGYVPYTGANANVDLGLYGLTSNYLTMGQNDLLTLGTGTLLHDGTDFVFNDSISCGGAISGQSSVNSGLVVNEAGGGTIDDDFRAETVGNINAFVIDASADEVLVGVDFIVNTSDLYVDTTNNRVGIGNATPTAKLEVAGAIATAVATKTANYTLTETDSVVLVNGTFTMTLPTAVGITGRKYTIKNIGVGTVTVDGAGTETIDGALTKSLPTQYDVVQIISDNANWHIV